jgi:hypothetical protein
MMKQDRRMSGRIQRAAAIGLVLAAASVTLADWNVQRLVSPNPALTFESILEIDGNQVAVIAHDGSYQNFLRLLGDLSTNAWINLTPPGTINYELASLDGGQQGGSVTVSVPPWTASHASIWRGTAGSWVDLHPPAPVFSSRVISMRGDQQGGDYSVGNRVYACRWEGTAASWVDMAPAGAEFSQILAMTETQQFGIAQFGFNGRQRAIRWNGTAESWVDITPRWAESAVVIDADAEVQVGGAYVPIGPEYRQHAGLWRGTAVSWVDLNPLGAESSYARATRDGYQVGMATINGRTCAGLWTGTAASWTNLQQILPSSYSNSSAEDVQRIGLAIRVAGTAYTTTGVTHPVIWTFRCYADLAGGGDDGFEADGTVDGADFIAFINSFALGDVSIDSKADLVGEGLIGRDPDGTIDGSDVIAFVNAFSAGC